MCEAKYRFSPSLLDKFNHYLCSLAVFESDLNWNDEEGYKKSLEEIEEERKQELLDALNRVPFTSEAAAKGTAFNEAVDSVINERRGCVSLAWMNDEKVEFYKVTNEVVGVNCDGFSFEFDRNLVNEVADIVAEGSPQLHFQAILPTNKGDVLLHGFPDYILPTQITDLKTTKSYTFGQYEEYWQRFTYPYILLNLGLMERIDCFEFLVVEWKQTKNDPYIGGTIYREGYTDVTEDKCRAELQWICEGLIDFIEDNRDLITNPRIFNEL